MELRENGLQRTLQWNSSQPNPQQQHQPKQPHEQWQQSKQHSPGAKQQRSSKIRSNHLRISTLKTQQSPILQHHPLNRNLNPRHSNPTSQIHSPMLPFELSSDLHENPLALRTARYPMKRLIVYGRRVFFQLGCSSTLSFGNRDGQRQLGSFLALFLPMIGFIAFTFQFKRGVCESSAMNSSQCALWLFTLVLTACLCCVLFFRCGFRDPGFIAIPLTAQERLALPTSQEQSGDSFPLRYCTACHIFKPLRAHHCRICDLCVIERDHHCPFLNNCIGRRNRRTYVYFLFVSILMQGLILADVSMQLIQPIVVGVDVVLLIQRVSFNLAIAQAIYAIIVTTNLLSLLLFQVRLAIHNLTTDEFRRIQCANPQQECIAIHQAFSRGKTGWQNIRSLIFCRPQPELIYVYFEGISDKYFKRRFFYFEEKKAAAFRATTLTATLPAAAAAATALTSTRTHAQINTTEQNRLIQPIQTNPHPTQQIKSTNSTKKPPSIFQQANQKEKTSLAISKEDDDAFYFPLTIFNAIDKPHPTTMKNQTGNTFQEQANSISPAAAASSDANGAGGNRNSFIKIQEVLEQSDHLTNQVNKTDINQKNQLTSTDGCPTSPLKRAAAAAGLGGGGSGIDRINLSNLPLTLSNVYSSADTTPQQHVSKLKSTQEQSIPSPEPKRIRPPILNESAKNPLIQHQVNQPDIILTNTTATSTSINNRNIYQQRQPNRAATTTGIMGQQQNISSNSNNNNNTSCTSRRVDSRKRTTVNPSSMESSSIVSTSLLDTSAFHFNNSHNQSVVLLDTSVDAFQSSFTQRQNLAARPHISREVSPSKQQSSQLTRYEGSSETNQLGLEVKRHKNLQLSKGKQLLSHALFQMGHLKGVQELRDAATNDSQFTYSQQPFGFGGVTNNAINSTTTSNHNSIGNKDPRRQKSGERIHRNPDMKQFDDIMNHF